MRLNNKELYEFFVEKEIPTLYHANTVTTSITYIEQYGLLSRGAVDKMGLTQTSQNSDEIDKVLNVWNDVFLDTIDLHSFFPRQNYYGPVLFEFDRELIKDEQFEIWITKNNPINWKKEMEDSDRYFINIQDLREKWETIPRQRKMITIRNSFSPILFNYARRVIVDDPKRTLIEDGKKLHVFNQSVKNIKEVLSPEHPLKGKFMTRNCQGFCYCTSNYLYQHSATDIKKLFLLY